MARTIGTDPGECKILEDVEKYGWHCVSILAEGDLPPYAFTVGLFQSYQHPELIIFGLPANVAHYILNVAIETIRTGHPINLALPSNQLPGGLPCCFVEVPVTAYLKNVGFCRWFYEGDSFPMYQLVWPSQEGYFPWHPAATESFRSIQPILGTPQHGT